MKKGLSLLIFITILLISTNVFAGDVPESLMNGNQKALFIGTITAESLETYTIIPHEIMMGSIEETEIEVKKFEKYYGTSDAPSVGDYIVAVLMDEYTVDDSWIFKCTSLNYKKLKLVSEKYNMVKSYEEYINKGEYFKAQQRIDEESSGSEILASDQEHGDLKGLVSDEERSDSEGLVSDKAQNKEQIAEDDTYKTKISNGLWIGLGGIVLIGAGGLLGMKRISKK